MAKPVLTLNRVLNDAKEVVRNFDVFRIPRVIVFNRIEARPRTLDFTRSLRAEVRDPLWMLTRQWQFGEFQGEDAASCVTSRIAYQHEPIDRLAFASQKGFVFDGTPMPLETRVERERIPLSVREKTDGKIFSDLLFAVQWGKQFLRLLKGANLDNHYYLYLDQFPLRVLPDEPAGGATRLIQDPDAEQLKASIGSRIADGVAIWRAVEAGKHDTWLDSQPGDDKPALKGIAATFANSCSAKFKRLFTQPDNSTDTSWLPNHLEYQFSVAGQPVPNDVQTVLFGEQYHQGHLDWYSFDVVTDRKATLEPEPDPVAKTEAVESFLPGNVRFKGQPQPRFWEMEETQTDFGKIETSATGLLHLMLAEFGLIYSNDWFMLPHPMNINTVCEIRGILIDDTFGRHTFIRPAGRGPESAWQRWAMFHLTERSDENLKIRYILGTTVPKNWIPFIAVHAQGSVSEIRLQRARMVGGEPARGWILREPGSPYFVEEEEVPRTGIFVERSWQRTRWLEGRTFIWVGRRKTAGRGEGWSRLVFDQIEDLPPKPE